MRLRTDRHKQTDTQTYTQTRVTTIHFASSTTHAKCNKVLSCLDGGCESGAYVSERFFDARVDSLRRDRGSQELRAARAEPTRRTACRPTGTDGPSLRHPPLQSPPRLPGTCTPAAMT